MDPFEKMLIRAETERDEARAALRRVEALADEWEGWAKFRSTPRIDAFRDAAEQVRASLASPTALQP